MLQDITVSRVIAVVRLLHSPVGVRTERRCRERWGVALKMGGKTVYTAQGKELLSDRTHPVLLPKGSRYTWVCHEPGPCIIIEFDAPEQAEELIGFSVAEPDAVINAVEWIERSLAAKGNAYQLECKQLLYRVLMLLSNSEKRGYAPSEKQRLLQPAVDYLNERYFDPALSNDALAALCGKSTVYFRKTFTAVYGVPPMQYLSDLRIRKAKQLLSSDYSSIAQIAQSVGYGSIYHFSKMFKNTVGISPTEYAKRRNR